MKLAIIGLACRFPGNSNSPDQFFTNLVEGKDCIVDIPPERWNKDHFFNSDKNTPGKILTKKGGFMDDIFNFDNEAFTMSLKEASNIDPQQKVLLEVSLQALEDANIKYRGTKTGVFIGTGQVDFSELSLSKVEYINEHTSHGSALSIHSNILSYKFDLRGPSVSVDTACSSSGTAMYLATRSLQFGDCDQALVGGINMVLNHGMSVAFSKLGVLSVEGKCRSFDEDAKGYVRSEGCGVVIVKPLEKAIQDGNHIYCVISATSSNEDGALSPSLTMPSSEAQQTVMKSAIKEAKIDPKSLFYMEAHATGTLVGDPSEANAIGTVFGKDRVLDKLRIGSVKSNIGHCECASYMASLIKVALMLDNRKLVPSIHFHKPNPKIKFDELNMQVQTKVEDFDPDGKLFGISSFGFGGANICSILEGYVETKSAKPNDGLVAPHLFIVQALSETALAQQIENISNLDDVDPHQLMFTLNSSYRKGYRFKKFGIGETFQSAKFSETIRTPDEDQPICMVFSGQGPQNIKMGRTLYARFPHFAEIIQKCDKIYQGFSGISLINDIGLFGSLVGKAEDVHKIHITLPSLIFLQIGLFELWKHFGVVPSVVMGHSFGEMCAIYASGACTLSDVMEVTAARAKLMTKLDKQGTMIALGCSEKQALDIISELKLEKIWVAASNSPSSTTLGGIVESVKAVAAFCDKNKIFARILNVTNAYHTPLLSCLREEAIGEFSTITSQKPKTRFISTVTGELWTNEFSPEYFWQNIEGVVLFQKSVETALSIFGQNTVFLEMAAHPVLSTALKQCGASDIFYSMHREEMEQVTILRALGQLSCDLNWENVVGKYARCKIPLYPFQRRLCFAENEFHRNARFVPEYSHNHSFLGTLSHNSTETWKTVINQRAYPFLQDHVVKQSVVFPGAGFVEFALECLGKNLQNFAILSTLLTPTDHTLYHVETLRKGNSIEIFGKKENDSSWTLHAKAMASSKPSNPPSPLDIAFITRKCPTILLKDSVYKRFEVMGLSYGPNFQCITTLHQGEEESLALLSTKHLTDMDRFVLHPAVLDCSFQCFLGSIQNCAKVYLPVGIDSMDLYSTVPEEFYTWCNVTEFTDSKIKGDIYGLTMDGQVIYCIKGFRANVMQEKLDFAGPNPTTVTWQSKTLPTISLQNPDLKNDAWKKIVASMDEIGQHIAFYLAQVIPTLDVSKLDLAQQRHVNWCKSFLEQTQPKQLTHPIEGFDIEMEQIDRMGAHLKDLITNHNNAVANVMFSDQLLTKVYEQSITFRPSLEILVPLIEQVCKSSDRVFRILEIGSGTGGLSSLLLPVLKQFQGRVEYYFTDCTTNFCNQAEKKFQEYFFVQYKVIDIEKSFEQQGIPLGSLDLIVGFDVAHVSVDIKSSCVNLSEALAPNGLLMLIEPTNIYHYMHFIFGVFKGWWHFTDDRTKCCLEVNEWKSILPQVGFQNDVYHTIPDHVHSVIIAQKTPVKKPEVEFMTIQETDPVKFLEFIQKHCDSKPSLIVVTNGAQMECSNPNQASIIGIARVAANEYLNWNIKCIDVDALSHLSTWIDQVKQYPSQFEFENTIRDNQQFVPRMREIIASTENETPLSMFRLESDQPGLLNSLSYHDFEAIVAPTQVLVQVIAAALNFKDVMLAMNMLDIPEQRLGLEFSGKIVSVGSKCTKFKIGDLVYGFAKNSLASHVVADQSLIVKKPSHLTHAEACSIPAVFVTSYYSLVTKANMQKGQTLLVHSAAGGVGQSAIQITKWLGGNIIASVGSTDKREFLSRTYQLDKFVDSHSPDWDQQVALLKCPVDIVLNSLAKENIEKGIKTLAPFGTFVEIGKRDLLENNVIHLAPFLQNLSYHSVHLDMMLETRQDFVGSLLEQVNILFESKTFQPIVDKTFGCDQVHEAFRYMQSGKHCGKIVLNFEKWPQTIKESSNPFSEQKTYVLSGGLGAVGFEILKWMASKGAKYIVCLSRNGSLSKYQQRELKNISCHVLVSKTDIVDLHQVEACWKEVDMKGWPRIGGIIQLAMVLDDARIPIMDSKRFNNVFDPKVIGSQNLIHSFKPQDLDFFILFSSISSIIGNPEQSNYASANAYLDAFAMNLSKKGYKSHVVNLGAVDDVGVIATNFLLRKMMQLKNIQNTKFTVHHVFALLKFVLKSKVVQHIPTFDLITLCKTYPMIAEKASHLVVYKSEETTTSSEILTVDTLKEMIARMLQIEAKSMNENEKLITYGVDSLLAVEISSLLAKFKLQVSQMDILGGASISSILK